MQFHACLLHFRLTSPLLARRLFTLFDREMCGSIVATEFTVAAILLWCAVHALGLVLLSLQHEALMSLLYSPGAVHSKLNESFKLLDHDERGFLLRSEVLMLFEILYMVTLDASAEILCSIDEILTGTDSKYSHMAALLIHSRIRHHLDVLIGELESFVGNNCHSFHFKTFFRWAEQSNDFLPWLALLRQKSLAILSNY